ncbi:GGDEF domain-containing protein [uncultured Ruminococcus sp.]|uniref:GGDEF domain-containing protein n=1 Tax=uncultured Ruminococcus sp. TaxID=165186 RepID=UPI0025FF7480|nr:GGDEF domain-containing protein [uncultured Ruminococcus sp.]
MGGEAHNRRRVRIGLLVSHLGDDFDSSVCNGAMIAAKQHDVDLIILPGRYIDAEYADKIRTQYEYQYNTLFTLGKDEGFDALLVLVGTIGSNINKDRRREFLEQFGDIPIITLTSNIDGYPCISVDNRTGLVQVIEHLINTHNCKKIGFVSGPMTSDDAVERFDVYKQTLAANGIEYDESRVAYGNFSRYVTSEVGELLDRCPDLEAIVFSNDQMAVGGYEAMLERGITPGKDIFVTGFDDDHVATELTPHLTTVSMDSTDLGYNALIEAVNYINDGTLQRDTLSSSMIIRNSCGCSDSARLGVAEFYRYPSDIRENADNISRSIFNRYRLSNESMYYRNSFAEIIRDLADCADRIMDDKDFEPFEIFDKLEKLIDLRFFVFTDIETLYSVMEVIHSSLACALDTRARQVKLNVIFVRMYKMIAERNEKIMQDKLNDSYFMTWLTNSLTCDMLIFDACNDEVYMTVVDKLDRLHIKTSYLYVFEHKLIHTKYEEWHLPDTLLLKAYSKDGEQKLLPASEQHISPDKLFSHSYFPHDRRYTMVCMPLFSNEEQYGLLMCEIEYEYFNYLQSIMVQLSAALKTISLMKQQAVIQKQLTQSLIEIRENNQLLGELSRQDELTGCLNRRGFFEAVGKLIRADENRGRGAVMIFADLDSLKTINDRFGHDEGDFAIMGVSKILVSTFRENEVIGRIGGDEFVVCVIENDGLTAAAIRQRIDEVTSKFNNCEGADKEYYVHPSVGVYPFKCCESLEVGDLLNHADALLYEQKKNKKSVIKAERDK